MRQVLINRIFTTALDKIQRCLAMTEWRQVSLRSSCLSKTLILMLLPLLHACNKPSVTAVYYAGGDKTTEIYLEDWNVAGPFTLTEDSVAMSDFAANRSFSLPAERQDTAIKLWHNGAYHPRYGQLDLREVFGLGITDTTKILERTVTYLSCTIKADRAKDMFLHVDTRMKWSGFVNGDSLTRMDISGMEIYPVRLKAGNNTLLVRAQGARGKYWYEATLYDSNGIASLYAEEHTGNIILPVISNDSITLTDDHQTITTNDIKLFFNDVNGNMTSETVLRKGVMTYHVPGLQANRAYICSMVIAGDTVRQPVMTYAIEDVEARFMAMRDSLAKGHPRSDEIDQLLYRVWKLGTVTGKMREDRWFPFKMPWLAYQLEHVFAHLDGTYGNDANEYNFRYLTYRSGLDGCLQRYVLVSPNHTDRNRKYPLVVVMRPCSEKRYHLFFSPQISHQYVVNDLQAVADRYGCFVIMPEARMMLNEDLTPFAEAEMRLAVADAQEHYNIDPDRIFLHANCSGGYRALRFAALNPDMFAAIALYAPVYRRNDEENVNKACAPETVLRNLRNTPLLIYGDPVDTHSPVSVYADLLTDCDKYNIPYRLTLRRNSGQGYRGYHRLLVGRYACEFFKDKSREGRTHVKYRYPVNDTTVADFYRRPFIYVYNAADTSAAYRQLLADVRKEYEGYLYARLPLDKDTMTSRMPLVPDTRVTRRMLTEKNVFLIGEDFGCHNVMAFAGEVVKAKPRVKPDEVVLTATVNPYNGDGMALLYTSGRGSRFAHLINYPWKHGFRRTMTPKPTRQ